MLRIDNIMRTSYCDLDIKIHFNNLKIHVFGLNYEKGSPTWIVPRHSHEFYSFHYISGGKGTGKSENNVYNLSAGNFLLIPPGIFYEQVTDKSDLLTLYHMFFSVKNESIKSPDVQSVPQEEADLLTECFLSQVPSYGKSDCSSTALFKSIAAELDNMNTGFYAKVYANLISIFINAYRSFTKPHKAPYKIPNVLSEEKRRHYLERIFVEDYKSMDRRHVCLILRLCERQVDRLVKKYYSMTFKEKLLRTRLDVAKGLLVDTSLSITQISEQIGISDAEYFGRMFKKYKGVPPSQYRKLHKGSIT